MKSLQNAQAVGDAWETLTRIDATPMLREARTYSGMRIFLTVENQLQRQAKAVAVLLHSSAQLLEF
jgi:hypothetical protein